MKRVIAGGALVIAGGVIGLLSTCSWYYLLIEFQNHNLSCLLFVFIPGIGAIIGTIIGYIIGALIGKDSMSKFASAAVAALVAIGVYFLGMFLLFTVGTPLIGQ